MLVSLNPANNEKIAEYDEHTDNEIHTILKQGSQAYLEWRKLSFSIRSDFMHKAAISLRKHADEYSKLITQEMGKPLNQSLAEIEKCAFICDFYADNTESFLNDLIIKSDASKSFVTFQPIGLVLAVMPWNFPFWQVFRFAVPALMAGNAGLLKHSSNVTGCALAIEQVFKNAGFDNGLFQTLKISSNKVAKIIEHPLVQAVTLTGSGAAGRAVAEKAGQMLKKSVLELGGSDAYLILDDADLDIAVPACVTSRLINSGQSCIAAKRFIVVESIKNEFESRFVELMKQKKLGDPMTNQIDVGPQAREDLRNELHQQVITSIEKGAICLLGGEIPNLPGAYYPPTILTNVTKGMPAHDEELFGPVAAIISAKDEKHAVEIANDSIFGLGAAVFTQDIKKGERIAARELEAGCCFLNDFVKSDPRLPFGGIKQSGYGRELSYFGIQEFVNIKTVYLS
ncbi:MAG: succinate-semialdehyde dehydrogenase/glutarate-semialdehyde dehydrogenase [Gammaproteobacteria bacterium]|jgi:succinate-semialdehyde dehydrogenase/glutarate-semialdehyde dehydrogenase